MLYVAALLIFLAINAVTWVVALAVYNGCVGEPNLFKHPHILIISGYVLFLATLFHLIPFPVGYFVSLGAWGLAVYMLGLSRIRSVTLFLILAALTFVARLAVLGVLEMFWPAAR